MVDFLGSSSSSDMTARKEAVMKQVQNETALANAQDLMNSTTDRCFAKCVLSPAASLSSSEQICLSRCFEKYMEAFTVVSRTYSSRLGRERQEQGGSVG